MRKRNVVIYKRIEGLGHFMASKFNLLRPSSLRRPLYAFAALNYQNKNSKTNKKILKNFRTKRILLKETLKPSGRILFCIGIEERFMIGNILCVCVSTNNMYLNCCTKSKSHT